METRLTPSQTAKLLDVTTRTLRRWSTAFGEGLSEPAKRKGKKRFYSSDDIQVLRLAQEQLREGKTIKEVAANLPQAPPESAESALVLSPEQNVLLGQVRERTAHLRNVSTDHEQRLEQLEKELAYFRWKSQPFWKRLGTPPPE